MSKLVVLRGNSGSGKTTTAIGLKKKYGSDVMLISLDYVKNDMLTVNADRFVLKELLFKLATFGKDNCKVVIIEGIFNSKKYLDLFDKLKNVFKDDVYAFYFDIPFEETLLRHENKLESNEFGEKEMRLWWNEKDFLSIIKEFVITKDLTLSETVQYIYEVVENGK